MDEKIFGYDKTDWERWQKEHQEFYDSLEGLEQVLLWEDGAPGFKEEYCQRQPRMALLPAADTARGMILVCPGGGYRMKSVFEGRMVAEKYRAYGFNAAVLDYRCGPYSTWDALDDAQRALRLLRYHAKEWNINPDKVAIGGFSAGGNLSTMAGLHYDYPPKTNDGIDSLNCRPDAVIQCYGAINAIEDFQIADKDSPRKDLIRMTGHLNVTSDTPPFFMWMTGEDMLSRKPMFDMANILDIYQIPCEAHLFPFGPHGMALADGSSKFGKKDPHVAHWMELSCEFLDILGF